MKLTLTRTNQNDDFTAGRINDICYTLELPWRENKRNISCIPPGRYFCIWELHNKHGRCIRLESVKGRDGILIHKGNSVSDTEGCILPGLKYAAGHVYNSLFAIYELYKATKGKAFELQIS